jgi:hypothetical protein
MSIRLMRGQAVIREDTSTGVLWMPDAKPRQVQTHRGLVLGLGPPALARRGKRYVPVPWDCKVGDVVQFHFEHHRDAHTRPWPEDGKAATWVPQWCVDGVIEQEIGT